LLLATYMPTCAGYTRGSCEGLCATFSPGRECYCDGYCIQNGDCCSDFEVECPDAHVLACRDSNDCLAAAGGPATSCAAFAAMTPTSCSDHPAFAKCCAVSCGLCKNGRVQGATLARRLNGNGAGDGLCVDEGALVCPNACSGHGDCDYAAAKCTCFDGWGADGDVAEYKAPDCSQRVRACVCACGCTCVASRRRSRAGN
jgi:hypothetical protein